MRRRNSSEKVCKKPAHPRVRGGRFCVSGGIHACECVFGELSHRGYGEGVENDWGFFLKGVLRDTDFQLVAIRTTNLHKSGVDTKAAVLVFLPFLTNSQKPGFDFLGIPFPSSPEVSPKYDYNARYFFFLGNLVLD